MKDTIELLCDLIRYPSTPGQEKEVMEAIAEAFEPVVDGLEFVAIPPSIVTDPDYSTPILGLDYEGRFNLRAVVRGTGGGRALIINTHADVVPPSIGQNAPFTPTVEGGFIHGRGACDAKGQIATLWRVLRSLRATDTALRGDLIIHIVVEEENGGNGTLALVRTGERADGALVLEPTNLKIVTSSRGAVWFRATCRGTPGHVGHAEGRVSALKIAVAVMETLEAFHDKLLEESRNIPLFEELENPMPITFGRLHSGDWPATVPGKAILDGVMGFLPNKRKEEVITGICQATEEQEGDSWTKGDVILDFTFRHDCHVTPRDSPIVKIMMEAAQACGTRAILSAWPASSDAWLYGNQLGIPTLIFGPGRLADAHSNHEKISADDIEQASKVLRCFVHEWCDGT